VAQTVEQAITLVLDPDDDLPTLRALRSLHARPLGQIVCEPPTSAAADLAHHLLAALGKNAGEPDGAWRRAQALLRAERVAHIVLLRAHRLTYAALRSVADAAQAADSRLWIIAVGETPIQPVRQLLEQRAHTTANIDHVLATLALHSHDDEQLPADHGNDFPLLAPTQHRRGRSDLLRDLRGDHRAAVSQGFDDAHAWMTAWVHDDRDRNVQPAADAIYRLAAAASTGSETLVRAHACLTALTAAGAAITPNALDGLQRDRWHEIRPAQHHHEIARAAAIADLCPDTAEAALIAFSVITRCAYTLRHVTAAHLSPDAAGAALHGRYVTAIPPDLRPALRAQRDLCAHLGPQTPLLTGLASGRPNKRTMLRCYERHNVPASLRADLDDTVDHDDIDESLGDDGREILARLHPANLFEP
jgi:hypothetical protein